MTAASRQATPCDDLETPGIARRLACSVYEALLLFGVAFAATALFSAASGGESAQGARRHLLQIYLVVVLAAYFLSCWLRGGQTLAMKAWRIRLIAPGMRRVPSSKALMRFALGAAALGSAWAAIASALIEREPLLAMALLALACFSPAWAFFDRDRQFLHDRLAGTRLVLVRKPPVSPAR